MEIKSFFGLESSVEKIAMKQYAANIKKVCFHWWFQMLDGFMSMIQTDLLWHFDNEYDFNQFFFLTWNLRLKSRND